MRPKTWENTYVYGIVQRTVKYIYLAKTKGQSISIASTYILFLTKLQKRVNPAKQICPLKKRYHNQLSRRQNDGYIAGIKGWIIKKAGSLLDPARLI